MTEDIIAVISGIVGVVVARLSYVRIYKNGKNRKQRRGYRSGCGGAAGGSLPGEVSLQRPWDDLYGVSPFSLGLSYKDHGLLRPGEAGGSHRCQ